MNRLPQPLNDPCVFSPRPRDARKLAKCYLSKLGPVSVILDVGFGEGFLLEEAARRGIAAVGVDRDAALVARARMRGFEVYDADVRTLLDVVQRAPFDGVVAAHIVEHLAPDDVSELLRALASLTSEGGTLLIATPNYRDIRVATEWFWNDATHVRPYTRGAIEQLAGDSWVFVDEGLEPIMWSRRAVLDYPWRIVKGRHFGRSGRWFRFQRVCA